MPSYNTDSIVLRRIDFGETDRIITLFSREHGKIGAIAKGAKKALSRFAGVSEVMTRSNCQLATGKSLDVVTQSEITESHPGVRNDLIRMAHGLYLVDLIDNATVERHPNPELFDLLAATLEALESVVSPALLVRWFEIRLLDDLGYNPDLTNCALCQCDLPGDFPEDLVFGLATSLGGAVCPDDLRWDSESDHYVLSRSALNLLMDLALTDDVGHLLRVETDGEGLLQVGRALRAYLRYRLERDLRSLEFLDSVTGAG